jgi:hypothetical protein
MSRFETLRRHLPTLSLLAGATLLVHALPSGVAEDLPPAESVSAQGLPLRSLLLGLARGLPDLGTFEGDRILAALLAAVASVGLFFAVWRLTRNRAVSFAAALLAASQPALIGLAAKNSESAVLAAAFLATASWALAIQARPHPASPRFPNRPASRFRGGVLLLLLLAVTSTPGGFLLFPLLLLADLIFARDAHREERAWASYLPYALVAGLGWFWSLGFPEGGGLTPSEAWRLLLLPSRGAAELLGVALATAGTLAAGILLFADVGLRMGERRTLIRFGAFGFGWTTLGVFGLWPWAKAAPLEALATLGLGLMVFVAAAAWRLVNALLPPFAEEGQPRPRPQIPAWSELRAHFDLRPLPAIELAPAAAEGPLDAELAAKPSPPPRPPLVSLLARIESPTLGVEEGLSLARFREEVRPLIPEGGRLLEFTPHGRFSPYSGILSALGGSTTLLVPTRDGGEPASEEFRDISGVEVRGVRDDGDWVLGSVEADFVLFAFGVGTIDAEAARRTLERLVGCAAPGARIVGMLTPALRELLELEESELEEFARARGLDIEDAGTADGLLRWRRTSP